MRRVSGLLGLSDDRLAGLLRNPPRAPAATSATTDRLHPEPNAAPPRPAPPVTPGTRSERWFLAMCIAVPDAGAAALEPGDAELLLSSEPLRRAARQLRGRTRTPLTDLPGDDEPFAKIMAALVDLAGRVPEPSPDRLEHARLVLDLERLERLVLRARAEGAGTSELAQERERARDAYRAVVSRLEGTV